VGGIADVSEVHASFRVDPGEACLCLLVATIIDIEDIGSIFLRNVGELLPDYTASYRGI
jgi:hypothetical protein